MSHSVEQTRPLVSIVIDNYNYADYLAQAIDSALTQTWKPLEVIVVDDGSTDDSVEVIRSYGDRIIPVLQVNGGQGAAFNAGWSACSGDVVIFLDSDDALHEDFAEQAVKALTDQPDAALVQFRVQVVDRRRTPTSAVVPPAHVALPQGDIADDVRRWVTGSSLGPNLSVAFRRTALQVLMPVPEHRLRQGVDFFLVRGAALLGSVVGVDAVLADYRAHGANDSNRSTLSVAGLRTEMLRHVEYGALLTEFCERHQLTPPADPLEAADPLFLSRRLVSVTYDPAGHPFAADTRAALAAAGLSAVRKRRDIAATARLVHCGWFLAVGYGPARLAKRLGPALLLPQSRGRVGQALDLLLAGANRLRRCGKPARSWRQQRRLPAPPKAR
jgi:hypothetical protein